MAKHILFVLSEWGYWGEELIGPLAACDAAGYQVTFLTPTGEKPTPLGAILTPGFLDPPWGKSVTSAELAERTRQIRNSDGLDRPKICPRRSRSDRIPVLPPTCVTPKPTPPDAKISATRIRAAMWWREASSAAAGESFRLLQTLASKLFSTGFQNGGR